MTEKQLQQKLEFDAKIQASLYALAFEQGRKQGLVEGLQLAIKKLEGK